MTMAERLALARSRRGMTLRQIGALAGVDSNTIWRYESGYREPSALALRGLASLYGVTVSWLSSEDETHSAPDDTLTESRVVSFSDKAVRSSIPSEPSGSPYLGVEALEDLKSEIGERIDSLEAAIRSTAEHIHEPTLEMRHVEIYEVDAAAGAGMHIDDAPVKGTLAFRREWLDSNSIDPVQCSIIGVAGESMEPTLVEGCSILVDRSNYRRRRREGRIFVINAEEGLIVKRAAKDTAGDWFIESDHPAWDPEPWPENAEVVGEVRWMARTF